MASTFEQQSARRKFIYFGLILLLFTGSLLHRKLIVNTQANELLMRDVGRGKADLTDAALRLTLSGVRGVAVTSLWLTAIERQKRHEWNELELAVDSLTHLQPRFQAPWLFQGWNLAFNVAVECDRARDKYYYVSRGIALLCRGEEKNDPGQAVPPQPWPASPDLRFEIGRTYKSKIGQSDENKTMRCLFDLSCIPQAERNPDLFTTLGPQGKQLNLAKFKLFCENNPRFVRRLRERLYGYEKPEAVVQFLADNKDIPGRLEERTNLDEDKRLEEFPILPPLNDTALAICGYPDWRSPVLGSSVEDFDVFVCMRAWDAYAQVPVPEPEVDHDPSKFDRLKHRKPRFTTAVFRSYPARAQQFVSEELQKDGWFDDSGWAITGWFDALTLSPLVVVGAGPKYNSGEAWNKAYQLCRAFGIRSSLIMEPEEEKKLAEEAVKQGSNSLVAKKLRTLQDIRRIINFDNFIQQTKVERMADTVAARKAIFEVEHTKDDADVNVVNTYCEKVLPQWLDLLLRNPDYRKISYIQEETYELQAKLFKELQNTDWRYKAILENIVKDWAFAALSAWPSGPLPRDQAPLDQLASRGADSGPQGVLRYFVEKKGIRVFPIPQVEGPFDQLFLLEGPEVEAIKPVAMILARSAVWPPRPVDSRTPDYAFARFVVWPPPQGSTPINPEIGLGRQAIWPPSKAFLSSGNVTVLAGGPAGTAWPAPVFLMLSSAEERRIPTQLASHRQPPSGQGWIPLVPLYSVDQARNYIRWMNPRRDQGP
jgi:hypothetical protein